MTPPSRLPSLLRLGVLVLVALSAGCKDAKLPLSYLRKAAGEQTALAAEAPLDLPDEGAGLVEDLPPPIDRSWDRIAARDTLVALLTFNSTGYFIFKGEPMGFEYELLQAFTESKGMTLETVVVPDRQLLFHALNLGEGDVVAARLMARPEYEGLVGLTDPLYSTRPVVVQRAPEDVAREVDNPEPDADSAGAGDLPIPDSIAIRARLLTTPSELGGQEVHVQAGSDYYDRITELSDSLGETIELVEVENADQIEPLIEAVSEGRIRLTVSPQNLAELSKARFSNIVAEPVLGEPEPIVWVVRANDPTIRAQLDAWLSEPGTQRLKDLLYTKYFIDRRGYQRRVEDQLFTSETGQISQFDSLLAREASGLGWDWRLLAAQVAQESRFDPRARSFAGARGLLQLMPRTAREMGVRNPTNPAQNVAGGVRYLAQLSRLWSDIPDESERLKFVLASYNAGRGHVLDAQRLAAAAGDDPLKWEDVAYWLLQKSKPSVYRKNSLVRHGYVRGLEPVQYVSRILERYDRYRDIDNR
jgi:membrane-bound lytic murein transglycosylase F